MKIAGFITLGVSFAGAALLFVISLVLFLGHYGGGFLILLLLAILLGFIGGLAGIILVVLGRGK